jgi:hypothetical protein
LLSRMKFDPDEPANDREGLIFDEAVREHVDGIVALYYTGALQFVPNPFTTRSVEPLWRLFPETLEPFPVPRAAPR